MDDKWDLRFMRVAREVASWSKDPSTQVGAIMVKDRRILSTGYNGFPTGIADNHRLHNREEKYAVIIHGEENVLMNALKAGVSASDTTLYVYGLPICPSCMRLVIQSGITRVVLQDPLNARDVWRDKWENQSKPMLLEAGLNCNYIYGEI